MQQQIDQVTLTADGSTKVFLVEFPEDMVDGNYSLVESVETQDFNLAHRINQRLAKGYQITFFDGSGNAAAPPGGAQITAHFIATRVAS